MQLIIKAFSW